MRRKNYSVLCWTSWRASGAEIGSMEIEAPNASQAEHNAARNLRKCGHIEPHCVACLTPSDGL